VLLARSACLPDAGSIPQRASLRPLLLASLLIAAVWAIAASRWIMTDTVVPWDSKNQFYAFFRFIASALHAGYTPFWNPFHYGGHPSVADPQSLIFAPVFVAWAWLDPTPSMRAFDLVVYAHLLVGGLGVAGIGWRAGWPLPATVLAAVLFMLGGPAAGRLAHVGIILSYGLFPPALLLLSMALQRRSIVLAAAFGIVAGGLALGRNQAALLLCFVLAAALVAEFAAAPKRWRWLRERCWVLATMALASGALLVVPLLLTLQFTALSNRPQISLDAAHEASLYPANLATMAVADVMGSLEPDYWGPNNETLPEVGATDQSFNYLFVGATATAVLLWFGVAGGGLLRRGRRMLAGVLVASLLFMLGRYTPFYALAFHCVPGVDLFRRPVDASFPFAAALALLVGHLLVDYMREGRPRTPAWRLVAAAAGALALIAWAVLFSARSNRAVSSLAEVLKAAPIVLIAVGTLAWARSARARAVAAALVATLATGELVWWNAASALNAEDRSYYSVLERPSGKDAAILAVLQREIDADHRTGRHPRIEVEGVSGPWQNLAMTLGLEATNGYNPLRIGSYDRLVAPGEANYDVEQRLFPTTFDGYDSTLARELGLKYLVLGQPIEKLPHLARRPQSDLLVAGPNVWIYRLHGTEPRVEFLERGEMVALHAPSKIGPLAVPRGLLWRVRAHVPWTSRIVAWRPDRVDVEVAGVRAGMLVLHDLYYPGWIAAVDGRVQPIVPIRRLFRGVRVPAGRHRVVFRFEPLATANLRQALALALHLTR
jgi:hypothetical protein